MAGGFEEVKSRDGEKMVDGLGTEHSVIPCKSVVTAPCSLPPPELNKLFHTGEHLLEIKSRPGN